MKYFFVLILSSLLSFNTTSAQEKFNGLAEGPYKKLVIREAMVIPGHGGPPVGPYDIVIQGDKITDMIPFDPVTAKSRGIVERETGDRVIDAKGKYVMPGMIDCTCTANRSHASGICILFKISSWGYHHGSRFGSRIKIGNGTSKTEQTK